MDTNDEKIAKIKALKDKWPSAWVARREIGAFLGGALSPRTLANIDCVGQGPKRMVLNRTVVYAVDDLISWLADRVDYVGSNSKI